jgi:guanylate kinase
MLENDQKQTGKCVIFSAPSGAGKTTIVRALLERMDELAFSISACSREPRVNELHKKDYYFLGTDDFKEEIADDSFIEWEEVYADHFYGTLKHEVDRLWAENKVVVFDVDVYGGINLKKYFGDSALSFFIQPPSVEVLEKRLRKRQTETEDKIKTRMEKAGEELSKSVHFDQVVINTDLALTIDEVEGMIKEYIK